MDSSTLPQAFEVNIKIDLMDLREYSEFFHNVSEKIIELWVNDESAKQTIEKYMSTEMFASEYADGIYNYYLDVIDGNVKIGDCPTIKRFLEYCSHENVKPHELFLICGGFRNSIISVVSEMPFCSRDILEQITTVTDQNFAGVMYIYSQILEHNRVVIEQKNSLLEEQYFYDELTGLKNTNSLKKDIGDGSGYTLFLIDVNRLHEINECYGYSSGDIILTQMADFLSSLYQPFQAQIYRVVSDQFGIVFKNEEEDQSYIYSLIAILQNTLLTKVFDIFEDEVHYEISVQVTVGIAQESNLIVQASSALNSAKLKNLPYFIHKEKSVTRKNNTKKIQQLHSAIEDTRIVAFFQAIVNNETGKISKYESLVRMLDEENNVVSPFLFLEASKKSRLYPFLTQTVLQQACETFGDLGFDFSINIEMDDIVNPLTSQKILDTVRSFPNPQRIVFELVESEMISDSEEVDQFLEMIREMGCQLAIDDFGTGYSNFEYLLRIKANIIKIDGSLIKDLDTNVDKRAIVRSIVSFAKDIGAETVAEYVCNEKIFDIVKEMGITYSQGYYFAKPMAIIE